MPPARLPLCFFSLVSLLTLLPQGVAVAQDVSYEDVGGVRYRVTRRFVDQQVPTTVMRDQQQTVYAPQSTTETIRQQQLYSVPVTEYQMVSELHGRWNPFVKPYWTHKLEPVTRWQQQMATVEIPVTRTNLVPQTRTVQVPATEMRTERREIVERLAVGPSASYAAQSSAPRTNNGLAGVTTRSATIAAVPSRAAGGIAMKSDPPKQPTGWRNNETSRY